VEGKLSFANPQEVVQLGESLQLNYKTEPQSLKDSIQVNWSSENEQVATVSATGLVKGVAIGETNVLVKSTDGKLSASVKIIVSEIKLTGISVQNRFVIGYLNEQMQLSATITPANATNKTLTWSTFQNDIITLLPTGLVTAIKLGVGYATVSQGGVNDYSVVVSAKRGQEASAASVSVTAFNPTRHSWEVFLANTGTEKITVTKVTLFTGSSLGEEAGSSTQTVVLEPNTANRIADVPLTEVYANALSAKSAVQIEASIGSRPVYMMLNKNQQTTISDR
jgi:uncharacterized protein YjdB